MVVPRPVLARQPARWFKRATKADDVNKLRKLKAMAIAANDHERDGEFFAGEMMAKRGVETVTDSALAMNTLYGWLSDYGQSFVRPLWWMAGSFATFAFVYLCLIRWCVGRWDEVWFAIEFSFRNVVLLFGGLLTAALRPKEHLLSFESKYHDLIHQGLNLDWMVGLAVGQNFVGIILLFLFLLALRNKFRLK